MNAVKHFIKLARESAKMDSRPECADAEGFIALYSTSISKADRLVAGNECPLLKLVKGHTSKEYEPVVALALGQTLLEGIFAAPQPELVRTLSQCVQQALQIAEAMPHTRSSFDDEKRRKYERVVPAAITLDVFALACDLVEIELRAAEKESNNTQQTRMMEKLLELAQSQRRFEYLQRMCERICAEEGAAFEVVLPILVKLALTDSSKPAEMHLFPTAEELRRQHEPVSRSPSMHQSVFLKGLFPHFAANRSFEKLFQLCDAMSARSDATKPSRNQADGHQQPRAAVFTGEDDSLDADMPHPGVKWLDETLIGKLRDLDKTNGDANGRPIEWVYRFKYGNGSAHEAFETIDTFLEQRPPSAGDEAEVRKALEAISQVLKKLDAKLQICRH
jgi:hypothetical protein